jgi:hypothetical protein
MTDGSHGESPALLIAGDEHGLLTRGAAQARVAGGVADALAARADPVNPYYQPR